MLLGTVMAAALVVQHKEIDGPERRRIFDAAEAARLWAQDEARNLYPALTIVQSPPARRAFLEAEQRRCEQALLDAADVAVCKEYQVSPKVYRAILARPDLARQYSHAPEIEVNMSAGSGRVPPAWMRLQTRFRPDKVRLPEKLAKRFGYANPRTSADGLSVERKSALMDQLTGRPQEDFVGPPSPSGP